VYLLHYPIRGAEQFRRKVMLGGAAVERNPAIAPRDALHWRRWCAHYRDGTLEQDYQALILRDPEPYLEQGVLVDLRHLTSEQFAAAVADIIRRRTRRPPFAVRARRLVGAVMGRKAR
jgi:hypothetical protein